jgi:hypothetical protein
MGPFREPQSDAFIEFGDVVTIFHPSLNRPLLFVRQEKTILPRTNKDGLAFVEEHATEMGYDVVPVETQVYHLVCGASFLGSNNQGDPCVLVSRNWVHAEPFKRHGLRIVETPEAGFESEAAGVVVFKQRIFCRMAARRSKRTWKRLG